MKRWAFFLLLGMAGVLIVDRHAMAACDAGEYLAQVRWATGSEPTKLEIEQARFLGQFYRLAFEMASSDPISFVLTQVVPQPLSSECFGATINDDATALIIEKILIDNWVYSLGFRVNPPQPDGTITMDLAHMGDQFRLPGSIWDIWVGDTLLGEPAVFSEHQESVVCELSTFSEIFKVDVGGVFTGKARLSLDFLGMSLSDGSRAPGSITGIGWEGNYLLEGAPDVPFVMTPTQQSVYLMNDNLEASVEYDNEPLGVVPMETGSSALFLGLGHKAQVKVREDESACTDPAQKRYRYMGSVTRVTLPEPGLPPLRFRFVNYQASGENLVHEVVVPAGQSGFSETGSCFRPRYDY